MQNPSQSLRDALGGIHVLEFLKFLVVASIIKIGNTVIANGVGHGMGQ